MNGMTLESGITLRQEPRETAKLLSHFEPIRFVILAAILIWALILVLLIVLLSMKKARPRPRGGRIEVVATMPSEEIFPELRDSDAFGEVA